MGDLISRQAAIDAVKTYLGDYEISRTVQCRLRLLPSAGSERKMGEWIPVNDNRISGRCSICGWEAHLYEDDVVGMDYCPNCGARLEEKE